MKKRTLALVLAFMCAVSVSACADKSGEPTGDSHEEADDSREETDDSREETGGRRDEVGDSNEETGDSREEGGSTEDGSVSDEGMQGGTEVGTGTENDEEKYEYPSEDAGSVVEESRLGYSVLYDPTVFTLDDTGEGDSFMYHTAEVLERAVYVSVLAYPDMDAATLAQGLILQSGIDGTAEDVSFGKDRVEAKYFCVESEAEGITQTQKFYVIPKGEGALLVETGGYEGMPETAALKMEEILSSFSLKEE